MRRTCTILSVAAATLVSGCARSPAESFGMIGFRGMRVVFVSDSSDISIREESAKLQEIPIVAQDGSPEVVVRTAVGQALYGWGADCHSQFTPKRVTWDPRMGLSHASDGWNVGDAAGLLGYTKATNTDYIVAVNKVLVKRGEVGRGSPLTGRKTYFAEVSLDLSVIDAKEGKRVWRSPALGRTESTDSLQNLVPQALELAIDNFYTALPQVHRWGCREIVDRFK